MPDTERALVWKPKLLNGTAHTLGHADSHTCTSKSHRAGARRLCPKLTRHVACPLRASTSSSEENQTTRQSLSPFWPSHAESVVLVHSKP